MKVILISIVIVTCYCLRILVLYLPLHSLSLRNRLEQYFFHFLYLFTVQPSVKDNYNDDLISCCTWCEWSSCTAASYLAEELEVCGLSVCWKSLFLTAHSGRSISVHYKLHDGKKATKWPLSFTIKATQGFASCVHLVWSCNTRGDLFALAVTSYSSSKEKKSMKSVKLELVPHGWLPPPLRLVSGDTLCLCTLMSTLTNVWGHCYLDLKPPNQFALEFRSIFLPNLSRYIVDIAQLRVSLCEILS